MTIDPLLHTENLTIGFRNRRKTSVVASGLDLSLGPGQLVCLLGPNGAGKSTLMRTLAGMQPLLDGAIFLNGRPLASLKPADIARQLSIVLTEKVDTGLLPAYGVVALGRFPYTDWQGRLSHQDELVVQKAMLSVGAAELADRPVTELSDGERQKVMIARALAQEPRLILLDEPTAYLDLPRRVEIMQILHKLAHQENRTVLLSTHDLDLALRNGDQIWLLNEGELRQGTPEDLVLNGAFANTFANNGVQFDALTGSFSSERPAGVPIYISGAQLSSVWTKRAIERAGFQIARSEADAAVNVYCHPKRWEVQAEGKSLECHSISELLDYLDGYPGLHSNQFVNSRN